MTAVLGILCLALAARALRLRRARNRLRWEAATIDRVLPDAIDLLRLAARAGISVHQLITTVLSRLPHPVDEVFAEVQRRVERGVRLGDALDALDRLGESGEPLMAVLRSAAFDGTPLIGGLDRVADDARVLRRRRAEQAARRLPVQLLFPLLLCVLPAFALMAVVPLIAASLGDLRI